MSFAEINLIDQSSGTQVIEIPNALKIDDNKAYLKKVGNSIYIIPYHKPWEGLIDSVNEFTEDYMDKRDQPPQSKREPID